MDKKFTVTIARGFGSGGKTIGKMLADKLGIKFYDKELIRMASDASGINEALFGQSDEKTKNSVFNKPGVYKGEVIAPGNPDSFPRRTCSTIRRWSSSR